MDQNEEQKKFLEQQLQRCKEQDLILAEIEEKLQEMKKIAEDALEHKLTSFELEQFNNRMSVLKSEVKLLEVKLHTILH